MSPKPLGPFTVAEVLITPEQNKLQFESAEVSIQPKVMAVLSYLAIHHDRVISKEELLDKLWQGRVVSHASVQKSINHLRAAFAQLIGDREVVKNYSKKGYQLLFAPDWPNSSHGRPLLDIEQPAPADINSKIFHSPKQNHKHRLLRKSLLICGVFVSLSIGLFYLSQDRVNHFDRQHKIAFHSTKSFTSETGHERAALPHPDNMHVVYIRDIFDPDNFSLTESQLWIKTAGGQEWALSSSKGSWFKLAWSPDQRRLLAVEVLRHKGQPLSPDFFQTADYLYNIYILDLDLSNKHVVDKKLLTQWQGRFLSADWWDNDTLEFVARQGAYAVNQRYRFSIDSQEITTLKSVTSLTESQPVASAILDGNTVLALKRKNYIDVYFLDKQQNIISRHETQYKKVNISWIPDKSGALIFADGKHLSALYTDGEKVDIPYNQLKDKFVFWPRYAPDGQSIFITEKNYRSNIIEFLSSAKEDNLTENNALNFKPRYSHDGDNIVYVSVRNNQYQLWLLDADRKEQQLNIEQLGYISALSWSPDDKFIVYNADDSIYAYSLSDRSSSLLLDNTDNIQPLSYLADEKSLLALIRNDGIANIWRIGLDKRQFTQRSFGAIGSTYAAKAEVYFQYANKNGLWLLEDEAKKPLLLSDALPANSYILFVSANKLYYLSGGRCRESEIFSLDLSSNKIATYMQRGHSVISTSSFHPQRGSLGWHCYLAESNIVSLE